MHARSSNCKDIQTEVIPLLFSFLCSSCICSYSFLYAVFSNIPLKIVFQYFVDLPDESELELDSVDENAQVNYLETPTTMKPSKTTSTMADISPVDLTLEAARRSRHSRSPTTAADGGHPPVKGKSSPAHQARHVTPGKNVIGPDKSAKCPTSGNSGREDVLQVVFMHSELTCIREHMEKLNSVPKDISTLRNSVESSQGDVNVVGTHCVAMKTDVASMASDICNSANEVNSIKTCVIGLRSDTMALKGDLQNGL